MNAPIYNLTISARDAVHGTTSTRSVDGNTIAEAVASAQRAARGYFDKGYGEVCIEPIATVLNGSRLSYVNVAREVSAAYAALTLPPAPTADPYTLGRFEASDGTRWKISI